MDGLEFLALLSGSIVLLAFFHPVLACFLAVVSIIAAIIVVANR